MTDHTRALLVGLVGPDVGVGAVAIDGDHGLKPSEEAAILRAVPKRRAEFASGRRAARLALREIGRPETEILVGADRAPVWPRGVTGSITHDSGLALAAVVPLVRAEAIGIDLTEAIPLPRDLREQILRHPSEEEASDLEARVVFSAKEALFKALSSRVGHVFGFAAAEVEVDLAAGTFEARLVLPLGPYAEGQSWKGRVGIHGSRLVSVLVLRR